MFRIATLRRAVLGLSLAAAAAAPQMARADRPDGPGNAVTRVYAHQSDHYTVTFIGGRVATVIVSGDGDTDLDLFVRDQFGNLVASDTGPGDDCVVTFIPRWTGRYTIEVRNLGDVYNRYVLRAD